MLQRDYKGRLFGEWALGVAAFLSVKISKTILRLQDKVIRSCVSLVPSLANVVSDLHSC